MATTGGGGYASTHAAARSLRRRPPDCDGSGLPSGRLPPASSDSDDGGDDCGTGSPSSRAAAASGGDATGRSSPRRRSGGSSSASSARGAIRRIDDMVRNGDAHWEYGWDAIEEAVARNRERIYYPRVAAAAARSSGVDDGDVVDGGGGSLRGNGAGAGRGKRGRCSDGGRMKAVRFENDGDRDDADGDDEDDSRGDGGIRDVNVSVSANGKAASTISKRRRGAAGHEEAPPIVRNVRDESNCNGVGASDGTDGRGAAFGELVGGRPPSSIGQETFRWDDLVEEMTTEERRRLILSAIHPPHPFESEMDGGAALDDARFDAIVCGALKEVGETHLWEQTRRFPASDDGGGGGEGDNSEGHKANIDFLCLF